MKISTLISILFISIKHYAQPVSFDELSIVHNAKVITIDTSKRVFKIVHIGDSHIQADLFSGKIRSNLQQQYGNAGIGLLFPYKSINTNGPSTYRTSSINKLQANKIVRCKSECSVGIAAYNVILPTNAEIGFMVKYDTMPQHIQLIYQSVNADAIIINNDMDTNNYFTVQVDSFFYADYKEKVPANFTIKAKSFSVLNGILSDNGNHGVLYYTVGANGATINNYLNSNLFFAQLKQLQPDLVIVSLGTNESVSDIALDTFYNYQSMFHAKLKAVTSDTSNIIYTTPADNFKKHKSIIRKKIKGKWRKRNVKYYVNNTKAKEIRNTIIEFCNATNSMYWDLYEVMGGEKSMKNWVNKGFAAKDHIHFTKSGYELQGDLFYKALQKILTLK